jgi:hypothetical protein
MEYLRTSTFWTFLLTAAGIGIAICVAMNF